MSETIFNIHDVILLMTAFLCVLFAILLLTVKGDKRLSNIFLALFLLQQAAIPMDILISFGEEFRDIALNYSSNLFYAFGFGYWLEAPLLLWYVRSLIYKDYRLHTRDLIYVAPLILYCVYQVIYYYSMGYSDRSSFIEHYEISSDNIVSHWISFGREVFRTALGVVCLLELRRYQTHLLGNYSSLDKEELSWLSILVFGFTGLRAWSVLVLLGVVLSVSFGLNVNFSAMGLIGNYTTFLLVTLLIFFSLGHSSIYEGVDREKIVESSDNQEAHDPKHGEFVANYMQDQKPHLKATLTLDRLAEQLDMPSRLLSGVINRQFECNFFEFINSYRIEEAKSQLSQDSQRNIMDIMFDSGFNSKATFNTFFKKKVGQTPSEYRRQNRK